MSIYDELLKATGPVALTIREYLEPAQGADAVLFPATFASEENSDEKPDYVIDEIERGGKKIKVALVDSVGSQANRIEPIFKRKPYAALIPRVTVRIGDRETDLLDTGHRAADAIVRLSDQEAQFRKAFEAIRDSGQSWDLAQIAPTTIVFGGWDSRGTKVKLPRILGSVIRAWDVQRLNRKAQYFSVFEKEETEQLSEEFKIPSKGLSAEGLQDSPSGKSPGGVIAEGGVIREATLNLIVIRALVAETEEKTVKLQRYILGLALVAFTAPAELFLREGCLLVQSEKGAECKAVHRTGKRDKFELNEDKVLRFAEDAAKAFGVGAGISAVFEKERLGKAAEARAAKKPKKDVK